MASRVQKVGSSESLLNCSKCFEHYDDSDHSPIMFGCQHTVCKACLKDLLEAHFKEEHFPCPICRVQVEIKPDGVEGYAKNRLLMDILHQNKSNIKCVEHPQKTVSHFCITCAKTLCSVCVVRLVNSKEHSGHKIEDIEDTYARKDRGVALIETFTRAIASQMDKIVIQEKKLKNASEETKEQVAKLADEAVAHVRDEQKRLEDELSSLYIDIIESDNNEDVDNAFESVRVNLLSTTSKGMDALRQKIDVFITENDFKKIQQEAREQLQGIVQYEMNLQRTFNVIPGKLKLERLASSFLMPGPGFFSMPSLELPNKRGTSDAPIMAVVSPVRAPGAPAAAPGTSVVSPINTRFPMAMPSRMPAAAATLPRALVEQDHLHNLPEQHKCTGKIRPPKVPEFEPIVTLPDNVKLVTGEEEEEAVFEARAKLLRFVENEWKERGIGQIKILRSQENNHMRIVMRRDQIHKVCVNHYITSDIKVSYKEEDPEKKLLTWRALDFSDDEQNVEIFCCKFKTPETAAEFKKHMDKAISKADRNKQEKQNGTDKVSSFALETK